MPRFPLRLSIALTLTLSLSISSTPARADHALQPTRPLRLDEALAAALNVLPANANVRVIVRLDPTAHQRAIQAQLGRPMDARRAQRATLVAALQDAAQRSQRDVLEFLAQPAIAARTRAVRPLWIVNAIALSATPDVVRALAARDDVLMVTLDRWQKWIADDATPFPGPLRSAALPPFRTPLSATLGARVYADPPAPGEATWGIVRIGADRVWRELGVTGSNVVVANIDTGVDWHHPALKSRYRGWNGGSATDHLHNWFDATDEGAAYPSDLHGHGTHTMGTLVGEGGIGVAPGARWMAAKGLNGQGFGYFSWLHAAFQFMLAPNGNPALAPHVLSNSWGSNDGGSTEFLADVQALRAAGIVVVFANGNSGPAAGTVGAPASLPGVIAVGASDPDDDVARFSSRGPSPLDGVRPHLTAPGVGIVSSFPGGGYASASGTSMAAPHLAGVAALLLSVSPTLDITATLFALTNTAVPLSTTVPNNVSGWGRVDAYRAVLSVLPHGVITGYVLHAGQPISGAQVQAYDGIHSPSATTDALGRYAIPAPPGIYTLTAQAFGFAPSTSPPKIVAIGQGVHVNFSLAPLPSGIVRGTVSDLSTGHLLTQTLVRALGTPVLSRADSGPGYYVLHLPSGTYTLEARLTGYWVHTQVVTVSDGVITDAPITLTPTQRVLLVDSGAWYYASAAHFYRRAFDDLRLAYDERRIKRVPQDTPTLTELLRYDAVVWSAPWDAPGMVGAGEAISRYLASGGSLLLSGQDVAFYDGYYAPHPYFARLNAALLSDEAPSRRVVGPPNSLLAGRAFSITGGDGANNQDTPDVLTMRNADVSIPIARYDGDVRDNAWAGVLSRPCLDYQAALLSFGIEGIDTATSRAAVLSQTLAAFIAPRPSEGVALAESPHPNLEVPVVAPGQSLTYTIRVRHIGEQGVPQAFALTATSSDWSVHVLSPTLVLGPCQAVSVPLQVTAPPTAPWNTHNVVTLTATAVTSPHVSATLTLRSKTPAGILLVDDDRFFDREADYVHALAAHGNAADRWSTRGGDAQYAPPTETLRLYPLVIWFNAYDWFDPLSDGEATRLAAYLASGGRLFLTSQAALYYVASTHPLIARYFGVGAIDDTDATSSVVGAPGHVIGRRFPDNTLLTGPGGRFPYNWNLSTAIQPARGARVVLRGEQHQPFGLANSGPATLPTAPRATGDLAPADWRAVLMPFAFEALTATARADLMNRVVGWLSWLGESSLVPHAAVVGAGQPATFTLWLRPDLSAHGPLTTRLAISAQVSPSADVLTSELSHPAGHYAGDWQGVITAGQAISWTFVISPNSALSPGSSLSATAFFSLEDIGMRFSQQAEIQIDAPTLTATLALTPTPSRWGEPITATLWMTNLGYDSAPAAVALAIVPYPLRLLTPTVSASSGAVISASRWVRWQGALNSGQSITLTYVMTLPAFAVWPGAYYHAVSFGPHDAWHDQRDVWIEPRTMRHFLPIIRRTTP
ncbi:MAG: hypothetical protein D6709_02385 [Chloroflexi bacterium]|nr:MAG: hypothetical protein D6709_02385 [Chloroflexota bacterium]